MQHIDDINGKTVIKPFLSPSILVDLNLSSIKMVDINDDKIQKNYGGWFTRNISCFAYDHKLGFLRCGINKLKYNYKGSFEITLPKDYLLSNTGIYIKYQGIGWFSIKLIESTISDGGVTIRGGNSWKKLDTVREYEVFSVGNKPVIKNINFKKFYNKPFNVSLKAFIKGFNKLRIDNIAEVEITIRKGQFRIYDIKF